MAFECHENPFALVQNMQLSLIYSLFLQHLPFRITDDYRSESCLNSGCFMLFQKVLCQYDPHNSGFCTIYKNVLTGVFQLHNVTSHPALQGLSHQPQQPLTLETIPKEFTAYVRNEALCALGKLVEQTFRQLDIFRRIFL